MNCGGSSKMQVDEEDESEASGVQQHKDANTSGGGAECSGFVQYQLPDSYCCDSVVVFTNDGCERPPLHRLVRDWQSENMQKRAAMKRKNEEALSLSRGTSDSSPLSQSTSDSPGREGQWGRSGRSRAENSWGYDLFARTRNESQCSSDSWTLSGNSRTRNESQCSIDSLQLDQNLSQDSQDLTADSMEDDSKEMVTTAEFDYPTLEIGNSPSIKQLCSSIDTPSRSLEACLNSYTGSQELEFSVPKFRMPGSSNSALPMPCGSSSSTSVSSKTFPVASSPFRPSPSSVVPSHSTSLASSSSMPSPLISVPPLSVSSRSTIPQCPLSHDTQTTSPAITQSSTLSALAMAHSQDPQPSLFQLANSGSQESGSILKPPDSNVQQPQFALSMLAASNLQKTDSSKQFPSSLPGDSTKQPQFSLSDLAHSNLQSVTSTKLPQTNLARISNSNVQPSDSSVPPPQPSLSMLASSNLQPSSGNTMQAISSLHLQQSTTSTMQTILNLSMLASSSMQQSTTSTMQPSPNLSMLASSNLQQSIPSMLQPTLSLSMLANKSVQQSELNVQPAQSSLSMLAAANLQHQSSLSQLATAQSGISKACSSPFESPCITVPKLNFSKVNTGGLQSDFKSLKVSDVSTESKAKPSLPPPPGFYSLPNFSSSPSLPSAEFPPPCVPGSVISPPTQAPPSQSPEDDLERALRLATGEGDTALDIDLQSALVKNPESITAGDSAQNRPLSPITIETAQLNVDFTMLKRTPSTFGRIMATMPPTPKVKRLTERTITVPFRIFRFDTPSPDEIVRQALSDPNNPARYRLINRERQSRR